MTVANLIKQLSGFRDDTLVNLSDDTTVNSVEYDINTESIILCGKKKVSYTGPCYCTSEEWGAECGKANVSKTMQASKVKCPECLRMIADDPTLVGAKNV